MYKLTVIAGPNRGSTYAVQDGETTIGRQTGNVIVLQSSKVSKKHCKLVVSDDGVIVKDEGSSNGTFVNGVLTKARQIKNGDRISVGEFVFELTKPVARPARAAPALGALGGNVVQFPSAMNPASAPPAGAPMPGMGGTATGGQQMPTDIKGKAIWYFDHQIMPIFYGMNLKHEWRMVGIGLLSAFVLGNLVITVYPLMESGRQAVIKEVMRRAQFMAHQIVERNSAAIAQRAETKTDIGSIDREEGVKVALLIDLDNRIIAPQTKLNQYFTTGGEAIVAVKAKNAFRGGAETYKPVEVDAETVVAVEPLKILSPQAGKNIIVGMAVVSLDSTLSTPDIGEMGMAYSETLILTGILGGLILFILYRLTLKPFHVLNDDIDKVLKGDMTQVTHEFKFSEMDQLWDVINSALQRVPKGGVPGGGGDAMGGGLGGSAVDEYAGPMKMIAKIAKFGVIILDAERKILAMNPMFEEISGIRADASVGQDIPSVARDQAFGMFSNDLFDRTPVGGEGLSEDFDFSGVTFKMYGAAFGMPGTTAKCFLLAAVKGEG